MGFLGKSDKTTGRTSNTTVIAEGTVLNGELSLEGNLHVDGHIEGIIHASHDVSIGLVGVVEGTLVARRVVVAGALRGKVDCESIQVVGRGCLLGEVLSDDLTVEPGATFVGESRLREQAGASPQVALPLPVPAPEGSKLAARAPSQSLSEPAIAQEGDERPADIGVARLRVRGDGI